MFNRQRLKESSIQAD